MALVKCVHVGFLVLFCLSICSANRVLMGSIDFKKPKNEQSRVASETKSTGGGGSLNMGAQHWSFQGPVHMKQYFDPWNKQPDNMAHNEPFDPVSHDSKRKKRVDGEGEFRTTNQRAVSRPEPLRYEVHKIEDGRFMQAMAPVDEMHEIENGFVQAVMTPQYEVHDITHGLLQSPSLPPDEVHEIENGFVQAVMTP
ncbi:Uncharacterized protein Fot_48566 [Forsythia ovata]|uniref:Uncharacterized protein n=1 Tax=Forsythia ovata TaxID=205694 RepID=A0ABD1Q9E7_9LAMI